MEVGEDDKLGARQLKGCQFKEEFSDSVGEKWLQGLCVCVGVDVASEVFVVCVWLLVLILC